MALDTTVGGASSDSYVTVAEFDAYLLKMGLSTDADEATKEANLRRATLYLDSQYTYVGIPASSTQALQWPRSTTAYVNGYPIPSDEIPQPIKDAQCEFAFYTIDGGDLFADQAGRLVKSSRSKAGPVETQTEYLGGSRGNSVPAASMLLRPYLASGAGQIKLLRG